MAVNRQIVTAAAAWLALMGVALAAPSKLPQGLKICSTIDPKLDSCLKTAVTDAFPLVAKGLSSLSIPPIDPLEIKHLHIGQGEGPVKITLDFTDLHLIGLREAWIESIHMTPEPFRITGRVKFHGPITLAGPYKIDGSILLLPIVGNGMSNITLHNLVADINVPGEKYTKGGETYLKIQEFGLNLDVSSLTIQLTNLFNGDKALGETMNNFLNDNSQELYNELEPAFEQTLGASFKHITARFFQKVPYNKVFPPQ